MGPRVFSRGDPCRPVDRVGDVCPARGDVNVQRVDLLVQRRYSRWLSITAYCASPVNT